MEKEKRTIPNFDKYEVFSDGSVCSYHRSTCRNLKFSTSPAGYKYIVLCADNKRRKMLVHRLVAQLFIPNPQNKPHINHIDGNPGNNCVENLEWCTPKESMEHASRTGLVQKGSEKPNSKLTCKDCEIIFELFRTGSSARSISRRFEISVTQILSILNGKSYSVCGIKPVNTSKKLKHSIEDIKKMKEMRDNGISYCKIAYRFKSNRSTVIRYIERIKNGKY